MLRPYCAQISVTTDQCASMSENEQKMFAENPETKKTAGQVFAEYLHENKARKLTDEDVKVLLRRAFQGCDLVYKETDNEEEKGSDK